MEADTDEALARAVDAVYAAAPTDFVATRKEQVALLRADGLREVAKEVGALRKPSVAAAAMNATVRADDPVVARLQDVGARMRHAQSALDAAALGGLRDERDEVLAAWVAAAREHSGALTAAVEAEVRATAVAALADAAAGEVVTSGSLTRALSYSGFGEVDVADAVARTSTGVVLTRIEGGRSDEPDEPEEPDEPDELDRDDVVDEEEEGSDDRVAALEMRLDEAEKVVAAARAARTRAAAEDSAAEAELTDAASRVEEAEEVLAEAQRVATRADEVRARTSAALEAAVAELARSRSVRDAARAELEEAEDR